MSLMDRDYMREKPKSKTRIKTIPVYVVIGILAGTLGILSALDSKINLSYSVSNFIDDTFNGHNKHKIENITTDLTPILREVADELDYNDTSDTALSGWINSKYISDEQLGREIRRMGATPTKNDQNGDGKINCTDYAILFYKKAKALNIPVRIMSNSKLNHAFNAVQRVNNEWETIEPQAMDNKNGKIIMKNVWGKDYDPSYDTDITPQILRELQEKKSIRVSL